MKDDYELDNLLLLMRKGFEADYWIAPLLRYYDKFKDEKLIEFARALDNKFAHDWIIAIYPTTRIENVNAIIQAIDDAINVDAVLSSEALKLNFVDDLKQNLTNNIYGKRAARYIMLKLDMILHGHSSIMNIPETISIEHILPQNPDQRSQWMIDFTEENREKWANRIGNLTLISRRKNSSQNNRDYVDKKNRYFKGNVELFSNSVRIYQQYHTWTLSDLENNHLYVVSQIENAFGI